MSVTLLLGLEPSPAWVILGTELTLCHPPPVGFFRMTGWFGVPLPVGLFPTLSSQDLGFTMSTTILPVGSALDPDPWASSGPRVPYKL